MTRSMTTNITRAVAVGVLAALTMLLGAAPALAHARLESSDPADGATLDTAPQQISLTFNEPMTPDFTTVTVVGPDGSTHYETGEVAIDGGTVTATLQPLGEAGRYEIGYRVVSADGHPVAGSVAFTLTNPGPAAAAATPEPSAAAPAEPAAPAESPAAAAPEQDSGAPVWPWIVGAVVLVGGGVVAALRLGKG